MTSFFEAARTIEQGLKTEQIGTPVAVRIIVHDRADRGHIASLAANALARAAEWFAQQPDRLITGRDPESGQLTVLARFTGGQTALVSAGLSGRGRPLVAVEVWGSQGMLSWEDDAGSVCASDELLLNRQAQTLLARMQNAQTARSESDRSHRSAGPRPTAHKTLTPQPPPYGVLLVAGDQTHQPGYAEALAADGRCRLIGLADDANIPARRRSLNEQLAARLGVPMFDDLATALRRDDVHIVSVCAEPYRRGSIAVQAAEAGKHLYLDKPLAGSLADADAIVAAAAKSGVVAHMFSLVHSDAANRVRSLIDSGQLGELKSIHFDVCFAKGPAGTAALGKPRAESPKPERFELVESKRELTNVGVYPLVQLLTLIDDRVLCVSATTGNYFFREHQQNNMEDFGQMVLEFDGGLVASVSAGRTGWHSHPGGVLNRVFLMGTDGFAMVDAHRPRVEVWADVEAWRPPERDPEDPMGMWAPLPGSPFVIKPRQTWLTPPSAQSASTSDVAHFLSCIEQGRSSMVSAERAAVATEILMAGYQSAATGETIALPLPR